MPGRPLTRGTSSAQACRLPDQRWRGLCAGDDARSPSHAARPLSQAKRPLPVATPVRVAMAADSAALCIRCRAGGNCCCGCRCTNCCCWKCCCCCNCCCCGCSCRRCCSCCGCGCRDCGCCGCC